MNREQYLKLLIKNKGLTIKEFAKKINMPYSTLLSILNGSIGGAAVDNVAKICFGLGISISELQKYSGNPNVDGNIIDLTNHEKTVVISYRKQPEMQPAVDKLLGIRRDDISNKDVEIAAELSEIATRATEQPVKSKRHV
ncbi:helix-turn-helix domain-containing protein [Thermocaproicibacter melissae]|jgi:transcriptional regulator with XRE-family HTH domain|uniref:helix-turn-helix domain-containing protein n=1 Tax=Thermocaproicibacter melissae TaxID=2966552 RepID=UPI0024B060F7|nr:helix-turn-helix transcriptional regulator [Thermocaproicibacter melissae]WBY63698.1 helix-turn-helix transcriptional regulator [Thermocaproicibacter melissae]